jgi:hypothetical protein
MSRFVSLSGLPIALGLVFLLMAGLAPAPAAPAVIPDFSVDGGGWAAANVDLLPPATGPGPVGSDPSHLYIANGGGLQSNFRVADIRNPILQPWAAEQMKKANAEVLAGKIGLTARSSCRPAGVPGWEYFIIEPIYFIQSPKEILLFFSGDQQVRHIYMNVPHSKNPKPSWYGESVGRYEGDTLVVDTIGFNDKTFIDNYRTPHSDKLHVVERFHLVEGGKTLQADITIEDPVALTQQLHVMHQWRKVQGPMTESRCADGESFNPFGQQAEPIPTANKADF